MGSDDFFKKRKGNRKKRKEELKEMAPYRYLIVCEGKKTEPNYFNGIKTKIDVKYKNKIDVKNKVELDIEGTGRNTEDLVNYIIKIRSLSETPYGNVWAIFDKDDFTDEQFNNAITKAEHNDIKVGWSNEAIELWFLLHFEFLNTAIHRYQYIKKLSEYFRKNNINGGKYEKNLENIFDILNENGNIEDAIKRSEKLENYYREQNIKTQASMNPCTTIYKLVNDLLKYIE